MILEKIATREVCTISPRATGSDAASRMRENHVGDLVVTENRAGKDVPVGILTDRDLLLSTAALGVSPENVYVAEIMSEPLFTAKTSDGLMDVIDLMKRQGIKRVPLVSEMGELRGIVAAEDVLKLLADEFKALSALPSKQRKVELSRRRDFNPSARAS